MWSASSVRERNSFFVLLINLARISDCSASTGLQCELAGKMQHIATQLVRSVCNPIFSFAALLPY